MSQSNETKYPSSANLFQFCKLVLDHKFGGVRVIDQDVGQILGYDPADCSHWKKGKKNVKSIQAMKSIAQHLGVDERLVVDVATGEMNDEEAYFEYLGYGSAEIDSKVLEGIKKEFYRKHVSNWSKEKEQEFKKNLELHEPQISKVVEEIHEKIQFKEAPLYLPEIAANYTDIKLIPIQRQKDQSPSDVVSSKRNESGQLEIRYWEGHDSKPFVRFLMASHMAPYFFAKASIPHTKGALGDHSKIFEQTQNSIFASKLLTPANLVRQEIKNVNIAKDIVTQLADSFWVSKTFMNRRLKSILQGDENLS